MGENWDVDGLKRSVGASFPPTAKGMQGGGDGIIKGFWVELTEGMGWGGGGDKRFYVAGRADSCYTGGFLRLEIETESRVDRFSTLKVSMTKLHTGK